MDQSVIARAEKEQRKLARLIDLLLDWAEWMKRDRYVEGYPDHSPVIGGSGLKSFDDMCEAVDGATSEAIYACINDLSPAQSVAIHHRYLPSRFRVPPAFFREARVLAEAHENLMIKVQRKGVDLGN